MMREERDRKEKLLIKIIVLGSSNVGKTSLMTRFVEIMNFLTSGYYYYRYQGGNWKVFRFETSYSWCRLLNKTNGYP